MDNQDKREKLLLSAAMATVRRETFARGWIDIELQLAAPYRNADVALTIALAAALERIEALEVRLAALEPREYSEGGVHG